MNKQLIHCTKGYMQPLSLGATKCFDLVLTSTINISGKQNAEPDEESNF